MNFSLLFTGIVDLISVCGEFIVVCIFNIFRCGACFPFHLQMCMVLIEDATNSVLQDISCEICRPLYPYHVP